MNREMMMDNVIRKFGFEDNITIAFCISAENPNTPQEQLEMIYNKLMQR